MTYGAFFKELLAGSWKGRTKGKLWPRVKGSSAARPAPSYRAKSESRIRVSLIDLKQAAYATIANIRTFCVRYEPSLSGISKPISRTSLPMSF